MPNPLRHFLRLCVGDFNWQPPDWLSYSSAASASWARGHRRFCLGALVSTLIAFGVGWWIYDWVQSRPQPVTVTVTVESPGVTPLADVLVPQPIVIVFGDPVMPVDQDPDKPVAFPPGMEPAVPGEWRWRGDSRLLFTPREDWPAAQTYRIDLAQMVFPAHVLLAKYQVEAVTPPFAAAIRGMEFYIDPTNPAMKQVVTTIDFTHRVDPADLEKHVALSMIGGTEVFPANAPRFTINYDKHQRVGYVRSAALTLPEHEDFLRLALSKGLHTTQGSAVTAEDREQKVRVPDVFSFFHIEGTEGAIVRSDGGDPEQIIFLTTSSAAKTDDIRKALHVYLLPERKSDDGKKLWSSPQEIEPEILAQAIELPVKAVPSAEENAARHAFKISLESDGQLFVAVRKGVTALGGFVLGADYTGIVAAPELPREIEIQGEGGVLALSGERKLGIKSRGIAEIEYEIARVPADQINHLVSQTSGDFQNPEFRNYRFNEQNIARIATERQSLHIESRFKANYSAFDFSRHLQPAADGGSPMQGLFFLTAREWQDGRDDDDERDDGTGTRRFILVTDLGMIVKEAADGAREVFIASIKTGAPVAGVAVDILGKNGVPLVTGTTDADGRAHFASLGKPTREKRPVAFVARFGDDVAFMPFDRNDRLLDFSRFDIGGVESVSGAELDAFVFTERGVYRPGDEIHAGILVKQRDWQGKLDGLPVETEVIDARGATVQVRKLALPEMGFAEMSFQTRYESPTGYYAINVFLVRDGKRDVLLGSTSVNVKEFLPDRLKIESHLTKENPRGWVTPDDIHADIALRNLYGTPATQRRIKSSLVLNPARFAFDEFPDFVFFDRLADGREKPVKFQKIELGEMHTDDSGAARVDLDLERFADATYAATFYTEGFEADGGRSVATSNSLLVSPLDYVVGSRPDGDCSYIPMGGARAIDWIAINPALQKVAVEKLDARLIERSYVSVLARQESGSWAYDSVLRETTVRTEAVQIAATGLHYSLPTDVPGNFVLELREPERGARVGAVSFSVVGRGAVSRSLEKNAELEVKLSRLAWKTGENIELSIVAPYTGAGLITIERDRVYAHAWFSADKTSTVQHIRVPEGFEGTGYVNVSFIRALDSQEVFTSPLSYAAVPFQANVETRRLPVTLNVVKKATPGEPLRIGYKTDRPARIVVFAVDEGILQVTGYETPDPLAHFFRKAALMVRTSQIVDLILPEFSLQRSAAAFGGDGGGRRLNPFKRVTEKPVVFWSGVLDAEPREREVI